jgi:acetylornithine deacetylase
MERPLTQIDWGAVDDAVSAGLPAALATLAELVAEESTRGHEAGVQRIMRRELERLGFGVEELAIDPATLAADPASGIPALDYTGRPVLIGRRGGESARSLLIQGHVDVVPSGAAALWGSPPFAAREDDGWIYGRGAADMKGGLVTALLALEALAQAAPGSSDGALSFATVIEEECGGNGALAALLAGATADAVLLPEPTGLGLLVGGVGVVWCEITIERAGSHAGEPGSAGSALEVALEVIEGLRELVAALEREDAGTRDPAERYLLNVGTLQAGEWISNAPSSAVLGVRVGFPAAGSPLRAQERVRQAVEAVDPDAQVRFVGFRAEGYRIPDDDVFAAAIEQAHRETHGSTAARASGSATNDARFYARRGISAICYGPNGRNLHAVDEAIEIASIAAAARTLTRLIPRWLHEDGPWPT